MGSLVIPQFKPVYSQLLTGLNMDLPMDEPSGMVLDLFGGNHLTDNNGVTQAQGKFGLARQYTAASSQYSSLADNSMVSPGGISNDLWIHTRVYFDILANMGIGGQFGPAGSYSYLIYLDHGAAPADNIWFYVSVDGTALVNIRAATFGAVSISTWYDIDVWYDSRLGTINIAINNGAFDSAAFTGPIFNSTAPFYIGRWSSGEYMNGRINRMQLRKRVPTAADRSNLFAGARFPYRGST